MTPPAPRQHGRLVRLTPATTDTHPGPRFVPYVPPTGENVPGPPSMLATTEREADHGGRRAPTIYRTDPSAGPIPRRGVGIGARCALPRCARKRGARRPGG